MASEPYNGGIVGFTNSAAATASYIGPQEN